MTAAFQRFLNPAATLTVGAVPPIVLSNLDGTGLKFAWDIVRTNTNNPDKGEFSIWNLAPKLAKGIHEQFKALVGFRGVPMTFSFGWDGVAQIAFTGTIWDVTPSDRSQVVDTITTIEAGDGINPYRDKASSISFANARLDVVLRAIVAFPPDPTDIGNGGMGLIIPTDSQALILQAASELPIQNWGHITFGMNTRDAIDAIFETLGLTWRIQNNHLIAMRGGFINRPGPIIWAGSGLLNYKEKNDGGIQLEALADPTVEPGVQIKVLDEFGALVADPAYRVESVQFTGDTDGESLMFIEARKSVFP